MSIWIHDAARDVLDRADMSDNDIHGIENGWTVKTADGENVGSVEEKTDAYILVKSGLINTTQHYIPAVNLAHVNAEMKEIGINLSKAQVEGGDWSEPPAHGPRREGAPLNADSDEESDAIMEGTAVAGPERETEDVLRRG